MPEKSKQLIITCHGCFTASELTQGKYDWANPLFIDSRFPLERHAPVTRIVEPVEFDHHVSTSEVLTKFRGGLRRPVYEDALYFGIQQHKAYLKRPWVFLHEPVDTPSPIGAQSVFPRYIVIYSFNKVRVIDLYVDDGWIKFCIFAGIRVEN